MLADYAKAPLGEESDALNTLLYFGPEARRRLRESMDAGEIKLDTDRLAFLKYELSRTHAYVSLRIVDEQGVVRSLIERRKLPLNFKNHMEPDSLVNLQLCDFNGTPIRVGLNHIWARY